MRRPLGSLAVSSRPSHRLVRESRLRGLSCSPEIRLTVLAIDVALVSYHATPIADKALIVPERGARRLVRVATDFLTPARNGFVSGTLTPLAMHKLEADGEDSQVSVPQLLQHEQC